MGISWFFPFKEAHSSAYPLQGTISLRMSWARQAAWYPKAEPSFVDALASVRRYLWAQLNSPTPPASQGSLNSSSALYDMLVEVACYAA